jgi:AcrR family transcriptional regulator
MDGDLRATLVEAALAHVAEHGSRKTSLSDVAERAGVSRTTAYRVFGSKQGLIAAVTADEAARFLAGLETAVAADPTWEAALAYTLEELQGNAALQRVRRHEPEVLLGALMQGGDRPSVLDVVVQTAATVIAQRLDTSILRVSPLEAADWIARAIVSFLVVQPGEPVDGERFGDLILHGIAGRPSG